MRRRCRASGALRVSSDDEIIRLSQELGIDLKKDREQFYASFEKYLANIPQVESFALARQMLRDGKVYLSKESLVGMLRERIKKEVLKGLPIPIKVSPCRDRRLVEADRAAGGQKARRKQGQGWRS